MLLQCVVRLYSEGDISIVGDIHSIEEKELTDRDSYYL
jgi:hypothetical protein